MQLPLFNQWKTTVSILTIAYIDRIGKNHEPLLIKQRATRHEGVDAERVINKRPRLTRRCIPL